MTNNCGRALARWLGSGEDESKAVSEFNSDELAKLFPDVNYQGQKHERFLRRVACMQYAVGPSRFKWMLKMAKDCLAVEDGDKIDEKIGEIEDVVFSDEEGEESRTIADVIFHDSDEDSIVEEEEQEELEEVVVEEEEEDDDNLEWAEETEEEEDSRTLMDVKKAIYEAAGKLNSIDLAKSFFDISVKYKGQDHEKLKEFGVYMNSELGVKISIKRLAQLPDSIFPTFIYPETARQIKQLAVEALESFVLNNLKSMFAEKESSALKTQESISSNRPENAAQYEFEVGSLLVLALVLDLKPDVLISVWPTFEENTKFPVDDKILVLAWAISLAMRWDWMVGAFMWVRHLFPFLESESNISPKSKDVIMQWMVRIGYRTRPPYKHEVNLGFRKGERVVPPSYLELLARASFPADSKTRKATKTLRKGYRNLKNVALLASLGSEEAKQISEQLIPFAIKAAGEGNSCLAKEARNLFFCCLTNHPDSFKQWDNMYLKNLDGSVFILEKLSVKWLKMLSMNLSIFWPMMMTMKSVASKTEEALASEHDAAHQASLEKAQKYAKSILEKAKKHGKSILGLGQYLGGQNEEALINADTKTVLGPEITVRLGNLKEVLKHFDGFLSGTCSFACGVAAYSLANWVV